MSNNQVSGLLNDSLVGHLFCIYLRLYKPIDNIYYLVINKTDNLITALPENLKHIGLCDIKLTLGTKTIDFLDQKNRLLKEYSQLALRPFSSPETPIKLIKEEIHFVKKLLSKYKVHEMPIDVQDLKKIQEIKELFDSLAYVISIDQKQYKKFTLFLRKYLNQYLQKELDGQQNYALPQHYIDSILKIINNPEYIKIFGQKNIQLNREKNIFFCHSVIALVFQKQIKIRKMLITDKSVHVILDNLCTPVSKEPEDGRHCWIEEKTFYVILKNGVREPIIFENQRLSNSMFDVFQILFEHWQRFGEKTLETSEIKIRLIQRKYDQERVEGDFVKNTIGNIRMKIKSRHLSDIVVIQTGKKGYDLKIISPN